MKKENQRVAISKRLLKEGLLRLLERKDLDKINVSELCKEASINRATFYRHYQTPRDVLRDIESECSQELRNSLTIPKTMDDIKKITEDICVYLYQHSDLVKLLLRCHTGEELVREIIGNIWALSAALDTCPPMDPVSRQLTITYIGFGSYHLIRQWMMEDLPKTPQEVAALVFSISDVRKAATQ